MTFKINSHVMAKEPGMLSTTIMRGVLLSAVCFLLAASATLAQETGSAADAVAAAEAPVAEIVDTAMPGPADPAVARLEIFPSGVSLTSAGDGQTFVVQRIEPNGTTVDVTAEATVSVADAAIARLDAGTVLPVTSGQTRLVVAVGELTAEIPVSVTAHDVHPPISFRNDIMPVFSRAGCNSGSCHGAARGKDGFRLSLYGFDPAGDFHRLTREMPGRRINLATPEECLLVNKATGSVTHTGGTLFERDSRLYEAMVQWLKDGAPIDPGEVPAVTSIDIFPNAAVLVGTDATQKLSVRAHYADGTDRDVTHLAYFMTSNDNSVSVEQSGKAIAKNRGESFVMARFDTHTEGIPVIVLPADDQFEWPADVTGSNYIDSLIHTKLKNLHIAPSGVCSDAEFIRRVSIDICGVVPTSAEVTGFVEDPASDKRAKLVDALLERKEFVDIWVMKWSELLQIRSTQIVSYKATLLYYNWLQKQIQGNVPVDQMVRELLSSEGGTFTNPATNFYEAERDTLKLSENVAQVFLGARIQCAQCHNHPFDRWTMNDYYQFAAFFSQIGRKPGADPREQVVFNSGGGEMKHPVTGANMPPKFLGGEMPDVAGKDRRAELAGWLASRDNPMFARNLANIVWAHFMGRGIVHEVDDVRISNPPSNGPLLEELGTRFAGYGFDFKQLVRDICNSRVYQLTTVTNPTNKLDESNFSHAALRRIRAEVMLDVISQITETENKFRGLPSGAKAVEIADGNTSSYFLTTFGRATRDTVCSCEVKMEPNLSQALHLINGEAVHAKITQGNVIGKLIDQGLDDRAIIREIWLRSLAREPSETEIAGLLATFTGGEARKAELEDIFWAVLNSREFVFNH